jgi:hypothetical protein
MMGFGISGVEPSGYTTVFPMTEFHICHIIFISSAVTFMIVTA